MAESRYINQGPGTLSGCVQNASRWAQGPDLWLSGEDRIARSQPEASNTCAIAVEKLRVAPTSYVFDRKDVEWHGC